jgi:hypothetical protein
MEEKERERVRNAGGRGGKPSYKEGRREGEGEGESSLARSFPF